jgi:outer membrane protein assembly factor BamB
MNPHRSPPPSLPILVVAFGGRIFGMNPQTGQRVWVFEGDMVTQGAGTRLLIDDQRIYATFHQQFVVLDYLTGAVLRRAAMPGGTFGSMMIVEGRVYSAGNGAVACFSLDGALLWSDEFKGMGYGEVALGVPGYIVQQDQKG